MTNITDTNTKETELQKLEARVDELIDLCQRLREENRLLRQQQSALLAEKTKLARKHDVTRSQVESMIMRLKLMEQGA